MLLETPFAHPSCSMSCIRRGHRALELDNSQYWSWTTDSMASSQPFCYGPEGVPERILELLRISTSITAQDLLQSLYEQLKDTRVCVPPAAFSCC